MDASVTRLVAAVTAAAICDYSYSGGTMNEQHDVRVFTAAAICDYSYSGRGDPALTTLAECAEALFIRR